MYRSPFVNYHVSVNVPHSRALPQEGGVQPHVGIFALAASTQAAVDHE